MRIRVLILALVIFGVGLIGIFAGYGWFLEKQKRVVIGTARPTFPYSDYSLEELAKMYPQTVNENVATTQTPEETHAKFIASLKAGDIDEAVECCFRKGDWGKMKEGLQEIKERGLLPGMTGDLTKINLLVRGDTKTTFSYSGTLNGKKVGNIITFVKNIEGVWLIESL